MSTVMVSAAVNSAPLRTNFGKPACSTVIVIFPVGKDSATYRPFPLVTVERVNCVPSLTRVTFAPGTTAPAWSVTVPTMVPCDCANSWHEKSAANMAMAAKFLIIIRAPLLLLSAEQVDKSTLHENRIGTFCHWSKRMSITYDRFSSFHFMVGGRVGLPADEDESEIWKSLVRG